MRARPGRSRRPPVCGEEPAPFIPLDGHLLLASGALIGLESEPGIVGFTTPSISAQAVLNDARRPRSTGQTMAIGASVQMAGSHAIAAANSPESDDAGGVKTWGNLRT